MDALKRVVEKLRGENERLKRAAGDGGARAEAEKSAREAKKRAATLKEEVNRLTAKAKEADGAVLKLAQKQVRSFVSSYSPICEADEMICFLYSGSENR